LQRATHSEIAAALSSFASLPLKHMPDAALQGRFATVVRVVERYQSKVRGI
jgi:hypothetical protein